MKIIKKIGSLQFLIVISLVLILLLILSTSLEGLHGTTAAQKWVYQTKWFDLYLGLLWLNILCATIIRLPVRKSQLSFYVTHLGILGLLLGALMTRLLGIEGRILLFEGESANKLVQSSYVIQATYPNYSQRTIPISKSEFQLPVFGGNFEESFCILNPKDSQAAQKPNDHEALGKIGVRILKIIENAKEEPVVSEGRSEGLNRAVLVSMKSQAMHFDEKVWLIENGTAGNISNTAAFGPATLILRPAGIKAESTKFPQLFVTGAAGEELAMIDLSSVSADKSWPLSEGRSLTNIHYYTHAKVMGDHLEEIPTGSLNPAVEYDLIAANGSSEHFVKFAFFPDFEMMHGKNLSGQSDLFVTFEYPETANPAQSGSVLVFNVDSRNNWTYHSQSKDGMVKEGQLQLGQNYPTGWGDTVFSVDKIYTHANVTSTMVDAGKNEEGAFAAQIAIKDGNRTNELWLKQESETEIATGKGSLRLVLIPMVQDIPFQLTLKDFRKIDYPGTNTPASFESDVVLVDPQEKLTINRTISMNKPLDHKGYRIFQSSFIEDPYYGEASVFTLAKNPGIAPIYFSSVLVVLGATLQFYSKPGSKNGKKNG